MKAINLVPADQRRGAGGRAGRSGGAAYLLIGVLALGLVLFGAWTYTGKQLKEKESEAASLQARAAQRASQTAGLASYTKFDQMRAQRQQTVVQLADSRFDWAHAFGELSRVLPSNVWLTGLSATIAPGVAGDAGGGASDPLRASLAVPALELSGCATDQLAVTNLLAQLRTMNAVQRVSISKSDRADDIVGKRRSGPTDAAAPAATPGGSGEVRIDPCVDSRKATFSIVVFYKGVVAPPGRTRTPTLSGAAPAAGTAAQAPAAGQPVQPGQPTTPAPAPATATTGQAGAPPATTTPTTAAPAGDSQR